MTNIVLEYTNYLSIYGIIKSHFFVQEILFPENFKESFLNPVDTYDNTCLCNEAACHEMDFGK